MKELFLLRHAKSSWEDASLVDFERPLAPRGRRAAPLMGRQMAARGWHPCHVLVSPARRTRQTWRLVAAELGVAAERAVLETALYMGEAEDILELLRAAPPVAGGVLVVGHNPGLERLAARLCGPRSDERLAERLREKFPTAALARFTLDDDFTSLAGGGARLTHFLRPRDLS